ncbi:MAG: hypothetical protein J1F23_08430 [Oscillospiraceae bacterium]|nr:hypothetical protein [Oscillospiraceae bacterium]
MGAIRSSLVLNDGMTATLKKINKAMGMVLDSFDAVQRASGQTFNTANIAAARQEIGQANAMIEEMEQSYRDCNNQQSALNSQISEGTMAAGGLLSKIKGIAATYLGMKGISWVKESLSLFDTQKNAETQLKTVLNNMGVAGDAFDNLKAKASDLQSITAFGDESLIGGAAEFATYMQDDKAIAIMMETLTNYAAGMSGGGEVGYKEMVDYATGLGKIVNGSYDAMTKKGFTFTDQQKQIVENGTDMEKALVISDVVNESWANLATQMANTPKGQILQMKNSFSDMREELADRIYPAVMQFFNTINQNSGSTNGLITGLAKPINVVLILATKLVNALAGAYNFVSENWGVISPIVYGIVGAFIAYNAVLFINNAIQAISTGLKTAAAIAAVAHGTATAAEAAATTGMTAAQISFNAALLACPITWIIVGIIAIIALIFAVVGIINRVTGSSISAVGIITGALAVAGAFIWNLFLDLFDFILEIINYLVNPILAFANFFGNVFNDPVGSIIHLFGDLADNVLRVIQKIASALDLVFGSNLAATVEGWRNTLEVNVNTAAQKYGNGQYEEIVSALDLSVEGLGLNRIDYSNAWSSGYSWGEDLQKNMSLDNLLGGIGVDPFTDDTLDDIADYTGSIADNTNKSSEELSYLRDIAEKEAINRFTTAEIKVDMTGMTNRIENETDIDGIISYLTEGVAEALATAGEGVY